MASQKSVTNEELMEIMRDMMQMTSEGLGRVDHQLEEIRERLDGNEGETRELKIETLEVKRASYRQELRLGELAKIVENTHDEQLNMHGDINEILHRLITLEQKGKLNKAERLEAQQKLQGLIDWAKLAAKQINVPLKLT